MCVWLLISHCWVVILSGIDVSYSRQNRQLVLHLKQFCFFLTDWIQNHWPISRSCLSVNSQQIFKLSIAGKYAYMYKHQRMSQVSKKIKRICIVTHSFLPYRKHWRLACLCLCLQLAVKWNERTVLAVKQLYAIGPSTRSFGDFSNLDFDLYVFKTQICTMMKVWTNTEVKANVWGKLLFLFIVFWIMK